MNPDPRPPLVDYLQSIAAWRRQRADEYDRDPRNTRSANAIEALAAFIRDLPADEPRLARLARLTLRGEVMEPGQQLHLEVARFHFYHEEATSDGFLSHMVELAEADANEHGRFGGPQVPGDDPWR